MFGDIYLSSASFRNGLNITLPGYGDIPQIRTQEFKDRISKIQKKRFESKEEREKTSVATKSGFTKEVKKMMSDVHKKRFENPELRKQRSDTRKIYYINNPEAAKRVGEKTKSVLEKRPELKELAKQTFAKYYSEHPEKRGYEKQIINSDTMQICKGISSILNEVGVTRKVMQNRLNGYSKNPTPYRYYNAE